MRVELCVCVCMCVCVCIGGRNLGGVELWVGNNMRVFLLLYCHFSYGTCTLFFLVKHGEFV